jgi:hypothetical protein
MNKEQIFVLAKKYLEAGEHCDDGYCSPDWSADNDQLLKFAEEIYELGYSKGHSDAISIINEY